MHTLLYLNPEHIVFVRPGRAHQRGEHYDTGGGGAAPGGPKARPPRLPSHEHLRHLLLRPKVSAFFPLLSFFLSLSSCLPPVLGAAAVGPSHARITALRLRARIGWFASRFVDSSCAASPRLSPAALLAALSPTRGITLHLLSPAVDWTDTALRSARQSTFRSRESTARW